jgi:hypothetical protein
MKRLTLLLLCLVSISPAQDARKYREYLDAASVDHFSGTVLVAS